jgi:antitoxin (DNA-binding transcriptional repressor) of toxin-antitoxin stability system
LAKVTTGGYLREVKSVGIKKLKAQLSEYVRMAKAGEIILVTERDEVVAELRPARRQLSAPSGVEETLEALADSGQITRSSLPCQGWKAPRRGLPAGTGLAILEDLKEDRG